MPNQCYQNIYFISAGDDYIGISEETLTFQTEDEQKCITFTVFEDDIVEGEETLSVLIRSSMITVGQPEIADISIIDSSREYSTDNH